MIEENADRILKETGMEFLDDPDILRIFNEAGCVVQGSRVRFVSKALLDQLQTLKNKHSSIGDVRGRGLMLAIEFVKDRKTKEPDSMTTAAVFEQCREQGIILSKSGPTQSCLRMVPPLCLSLEDVEQVAENLDNALSNA